MNNSKNSHSIPNSDWIKKLIYWADSRFEFVAFQQGNGYELPGGPFKKRFFAGHRSLTEREIWTENSNGYRVGIIGYDYKNQIESLNSSNPAFIDLPDLSFFEAALVIEFKEEEMEFITPVSATFFDEINAIQLPANPKSDCKFSPQTSKQEYLSIIDRIQNEIIEGNTYEANFCQAFSGKFEVFDPIASYFHLNTISPMPFSALYKSNHNWLISASPERFLKKSGNHIIAQPIKGTIRRGKNPGEDLSQIQKLSKSEKEQAENLMITDLMRNDLSKVSKTASVKVDELFGIYPLPRIFQMMTTISAELMEAITFKEIIHATFPMGSMTGAPKISTMNIIDQLENFKRGWYSGAFGVIEPNGDFDFSVIIRSIITDQTAKKLYFGVGSAITIDAVATEEYEECLLKAQAIVEVLNGSK